MAAALYDERGGYYRGLGAERWGRAGDYRTAPERSPLFPATFARYFTRLYEELGRPRVFNLLEAGGGTGRFAHGVLKTLRRDAPHVYEATRYVFDEVGADSIERAAELLKPFAERVEFKRLSDINDRLEQAVVFSNELLDAFPVHRVRVRGGRLRELYVEVKGDGRFVFAEGEPSTPRLAEHFARLGVRLEEGQTAEVNLDVSDWLKRIKKTTVGGHVVTVDYGDEAAALYGAPHRRGGTLRAFRRHEFVEDVLADPGLQDLTTTVNWTQVISEGERLGLRAVSLERLDAFLLRAGLVEQLELESDHAADEADLAALRLGAGEMLLPGRLASHFQVLVQRTS
jgi:SAM-dependent MidA family methyltransferase